MKLKILTLRFSEKTGGFDDEPLQAFMAKREIIDYCEHFFFHENVPYLTVVLAHRRWAADERQRTVRREDPRKELDEKEKQVFDVLKAWRAARARMEGIPPYLIATNKQLAGMIKLNVASRSALTSIQGIGESKAAKYGEEIVQILREHLTKKPDKTQQPDGEPEP